MKKNTNYIKGWGMAALLTVFTLQAGAQTSPATIELIKAKRLWHQSNNAAGAVIDEAQTFSQVSLGYDMTRGNFHRPQEGESVNQLWFNSEGSMKLNKSYVWGLFNYSRDNINDAGYNASLVDPFRGMPYYVVDEHQSNWRNQDYLLQFKASTPLYWGHWAAGIEGTYRATMGAKQRDPRDDGRLMILGVKPGIIYSLDKHHIGAHFNYYSIKEESSMSNEGTSGLQQTYYELYGLGVATVGYGVGRTTNYAGNNYGGGLEYGYDNDKFHLLVEGSFNAKVEDATVSFSTPRKEGTVKDKIWNGTVNLYTGNERFTHFVKLGYENRHIDGIQYLTEWNNAADEQGWVTLYKNIRSTYKTQKAFAEYSIVANRDNEYSWKADAGVNYIKHDDRYLIPESFKNSENLLFYVNGSKNFALSEKLQKRLLVKATFAYNNNLSGEYQYGGPHADYITVTGLEQGDEDYLTSKYYRLGISAVYSQKFDPEQKISLFAKAKFNYTKTSDYDFNHRSYASFSIGCNF